MGSEQNVENFQTLIKKMSKEKKKSVDTETGKHIDSHIYSKQIFIYVKARTRSFL